MTVDFVLVGLLTGDLVELDGRPATPVELGGGCVYAAAGARLWSDSVGIASRAGADFPDGWLHELADHGIATDGVEHLDRPHGATLLASDMSYDSDGDRPEQRLSPDWGRDAEGARLLGQTVVDAEAPYCPNPDVLPEGWARRGVHLAGMGVEAPARWLRWLELHRPSGLTITMDSLWWKPGARPEPYVVLLRQVTALLPSRAEVSAYFDAPFQPQMATSLVEAGVPLVAIKLGRHGCLVLRQGESEPFALPTQATQVIDPTGAGDAFCGGFLVGLAETGDPIEAAVRGTASASLAVETHGLASLLHLHRTQVVRRANQLRESLMT